MVYPPLPAAALLLSALLLSATPATPAAPAAAPPEQVLREIRDLRVLLEYDDDSATFATWPEDKFGRRLPPDQIARAARLGLSLWASVLPDMRFGFVNRPEDANLSIRFGPYQQSGFGHDGGRAFLPSEWGALRAECGRYRENRLPDGSPCLETSHNIILIHQARWAVEAADYANPRRMGEFLAWVFDPARPHYREGEGPCRDGGAAGARWDAACVPFPRSPHYDSLGGLDLASIIQHEFGHVLLGDHTPPPFLSVDYHRKPVYLPGLTVRRSPGGFSVMLPGDGVDSWWNRRGVFAADAARLREMRYRIRFPRAAATIVLSRPDGAVLRTRDWKAAERAMIWPLASSFPGAEATRRQYYVVDIRLDAPEAGSRPGP